jgi:hypothetical protein
VLIAEAFAHELAEPLQAIALEIAESTHAAHRTPRRRA